MLKIEMVNAKNVNVYNWKIEQLNGFQKLTILQRN